MSKWYQRKVVTVTEEQKSLILLHHNKMKNKDLAAYVGISYQKLKNNLRSLGLVKLKAKVVQMFEDKEEIFDSYEFQKKYYKF